MKSLNTAFWTRITTSVSVSDRSLPVFRILLACWILLFHFESWFWIGELPDYLMMEPVLSLANVLRSYPDATLMYALDIFRLLLVACLLFGIRARSAGITLFVVSIFSKSLQYTLGSIEHDFLLYFLLFILSFSNWGTELALIPDSRRKAYSSGLLLGIFALCLTWGMFTAGFLKALVWIDFDTGTSGFMRWLTEGYYSMERNHFLTGFMLGVDWKWLEIMDYLAVVFELTPLIFLLRSRKAWITWILVAVAFHFINVLVLNINFMTHLLVYAVFIDWGRLYDVFVRIFQRYKAWLYAVAGVIVLARFSDILFGKAYFNLLFYFTADYYLTHLIFGMVILCLLAYRLVIEFRRAGKF